MSSGKEQSKSFGGVLGREWGKHFVTEPTQSDPAALKSVNCTNSQAIPSQEGSVRPLDVYYSYLRAIFLPDWDHQANNCDIKELPVSYLFCVPVHTCLANIL